MSDTATPPSILIVEDQPDIRTLQRYAFKPQGYTVAEAASGEEAITFLETNRPDLILLDVSMPGMSGFEVLEIVRGNPMTASIPVILLTAMASERDQLLGQELGANAYLTKPCPPAKLRDAVSQVLANGAYRPQEFR